MQNFRKNRLIEIERLRAVAVLYVTVGHIDALYQYLPNEWHHFWGGVDLFFVISGFVVTLAFIRTLPKSLSSTKSTWTRIQSSLNPLLQFYHRRIRRIFPAALFWLAVPFTLSLILESNGMNPSWIGPSRDLGNEIYGILTLGYNYALHTLPAPHYQVYWSLIVEEHFYLLLPLALILIPNWSSRIAFFSLITIGIGFVYRPIVTPWVPVGIKLMMRVASHRRFDALCAGVGVALAYLRVGKTIHDDIPKSTSTLLPNVIALTLVALIMILPGRTLEPVHEASIMSSLWVISAALVWMAAQDRGWVLNIPGFRNALEYIGSRSYSLYLSHAFMRNFEYMLRENGSTHSTEPMAQVLFHLSASLVLAELSYRWIECPFRIVAGSESRK